MQPGPLGTGPGPSWPKVIGIISIVLGALSVLGGAWGVIAPFLMSGFVAATGQSGVTAVMEKWRWWTVTDSACKGGFALFLILGGCLLSARRRSGASLLQLWAVLRIALGIMACVMSWQMMQDQIAANSSQGSRAPPAAMMAPMILFGVVFGLLWSLAYPVFLLVFLRLAGPRRTMSEWA
jgi:hypothetical protein